MFHGSWWQIFLKESPPRNISNYVKTRVVLIYALQLGLKRTGGSWWWFCVLSQSTGLEVPNLSCPMLAHACTHPIHSSTYWPWLWVLTNLKKSSPRLRNGGFQRSRKFGTWPLLTSCACMRVHICTHPKAHSVTFCPWKDKKTKRQKESRVKVREKKGFLWGEAPKEEKKRDFCGAKPLRQRTESQSRSPKGGATKGQGSGEEKKRDFCGATPRMKLKRVKMKRVKTKMVKSKRDKKGQKGSRHKGSWSPRWKGSRQKHKKGQGSRICQDKKG